jgi:hypothetical protein
VRHADTGVGEKSVISTSKTIFVFFSLFSNGGRERRRDRITKRAPVIVNHSRRRYRNPINQFRKMGKL